MSESILIGIAMLWLVVGVGVFVRSRCRRAARTKDDALADFGLPSESGSRPAAEDAVAIKELDAVADATGSASVPVGTSADKPADAGVVDQPPVEPTILARTELDELRGQLERDREAFARTQTKADEALGAREMKVSERETATQKREEALTQSEADEKERVTMLTQFEGTLMSREAAVKLREDASATAEVAAKLREGAATRAETAVKHRELMLAKDVDAMKVREMKLEVAFAKSRAEIAARSDVVSNAVEVVTEREVAVKAREDAVAMAEVAVKAHEDAIGMAAEVMKEREEKIKAREDEATRLSAEMRREGLAFAADLVILGQREASVLAREAAVKDLEAALARRDAEIEARERAAGLSPEIMLADEEPLSLKAKIFLVFVGLDGLAAVAGFAYFLFC